MTNVKKVNFFVDVSEMMYYTRDVNSESASKLARKKSFVQSTVLGLTVIIMVAALLVNVLHVVDLYRAAHGERTTREWLLQVIKPQSTTPTKPKDAGSPVLDAGGSVERSKHTSGKNFPAKTPRETLL